MHELLNKPHLQCFASADVPPGEDHVEGRLEANQTRQALRPATTRDQSELHFRKTERRFRRVARDAVGARDRRLEPTAEARAVDGRNDGRSKLLESVEQRMPVAAQRLGLR